MNNFEFRDWITRDMLQAEPNKFFLFGDNLARVGLGGQAAAMRGEWNALGIATKRSPGMNHKDFFSDQPDEIFAVMVDIAKVWRMLSQSNMTVVIPSAGLGTGLAELPHRSPKINSIIENFIEIARNYK